MKRILFFLFVFVLIAPSFVRAADADSDEAFAAADAKPSKTGGALKVSEFSPVGMTGSSVGITLDDQGRVYVTHTNRRNNGEIDIRKNRDWLLDSLALTSPEDRQALIKKRMPATWQDLAKFKEKIICVEDTNGDGRADKRTVVFEGFNELGSGLAGGVLWHDGALYVTCMPGLWKLTDRGDDGIFETKQELVHGIGFHIGYGGHDMHGPTLGCDGRIYWTSGDKGIHVKTSDGREIFFPGQGGCFRVETDGSGFEVFAHGLRNSQELAFDELGNLFTVDNDGDIGDKERVINIVEGADYAWRMHYQYRSDRSWAQMSGYNPWMADNLWRAPASGIYQPAYLTPAIANFSVGPVGLEYNPGTAMGPAWRRTFFLAESSKDIQAFNIEPSGAGFKFVNPRSVVTGPFTTGLFFGPDGALYGANWGDNPWAPHENGNSLKYDVPESQREPMRAEVRRLIAEGMTKRSAPELAKLLGHPDQRIRLKAQFELAKRHDIDTLLKSAAVGETMARVHAIWGIGQLARKDKAIAAKLVPLLRDADGEIRAQAARMIGDAHATDAASEVARLLADESPRVRALAGIAMRFIGSPAQFGAAVEMIARNNDSDPVLRHAGAMALAGCANSDRSTLAARSSHASRAVRMAAVIASRMLADPAAASFLNDSDIAIVSEAARAVHDDTSIPLALPALAAILDRPGLRDEPVLRRSISANIRTGDAKCAMRLLAYAQNKSAPLAMRVEALETLVLWPAGLAFDRVQGFYRGLPARDAAELKKAFALAFDSLVTDPSVAIQRASAKLVRELKYDEGIVRLTAIALDAKADAAMRVAALETMSVTRAPKLADAIAMFGKSELPAMRVAAIRAQAEVNPDAKETLTTIASLLKNGSLREQQAMYALLGGMKSKGAQKLLEQSLAELAAGTVRDELALDVYEAAANTPSLKKQLSKVDGSLKKRPFGVWNLALNGGDADEGDAIFHGHTTAACMQCHTMTAGVPSVGPDLSAVAMRRTPEELLRAVVDPQGQIADGYGMISATMNDGSVVSGLLTGETKDDIALRIPGTATTNVVKKSAVVSRSKPVSAMPDMTSLLTKVEVRNLVAFLKTLNGTAQRTSGEPIIATMKIEDVIAAVAKTTGDAQLGAKLFTRQGCVACHTAIAGEPLKGPFLGNVAKTYDRAALAEQILVPGKIIAKGFELHTITLKNGTVQAGFISSETPERITLRAITGMESAVSKADIAKNETNAGISLMPPGIAGNLTVKELAGLLDWLQGLAK